MYKKAFTLVELIVVITILSILATIGFISFQWYAMVTRDSVRMTDIKLIEETLEFYYTKNWEYQIPENSTNITYSWSIAWIQWEFWKSSMLKKVASASNFKDPLTDDPYAYSITNTQKEFQVASLLEGEYLWNLINETYAQANLAQAYVKWNYNWNFVKVTANNRDYLLWVPTILASNIDSVDLVEIINEKKLVYKTYNNIPYSYTWSKFNLDWWFDFNPNKLILFEWNIKELYKDNIKRVTFLDKLQTSYSWTLIQDEWVLSQVMKTEIDLLEPSNEASNLAAKILNIALNKNIAMLDIEINCLSWFRPENWSCIVNNIDIVAGLKSLSQSDTGFNLAWDNSNWASFYDIQINGTHITNTASNSVTLDGLVPNTDYNITVIAKNSYWETDPSSIYTVKTAPSPTTVVAQWAFEDIIWIQWLAIPGSVAYAIYQDGVFMWMVAWTSVWLNWLTANTSYDFMIQSIWANTAYWLTAVSSASNVLSFSTSPEAPTDMAIVHVSNDSIEMNWTPIPWAVQYSIYFNWGFVWATPNPNLVFHSLPQNFNYNFSIKSVVSWTVWSYIDQWPIWATASTTLWAISNFTLDSITSTTAHFSFDVMPSANKYASYINYWFKWYSADNTANLLDNTGLEANTSYNISLNSLDWTWGFWLRQSIPITTNP